MTISFRSKRRTSDCTHETQIRTEIAGMRRLVCENCGRVSLGYVDDHFQAQGSAQRIEESATRA
jgi:hypothetical protein